MVTLEFWWVNPVTDSTDHAQRCWSSQIRGRSHRMGLFRCPTSNRILHLKILTLRMYKSKRIIFQWKSDKQRKNCASTHLCRSCLTSQMIVCIIYSKCHHAVDIFRLKTYISWPGRYIKNFARGLDFNHIHLGLDVLNYVKYIPLTRHFNIVRCVCCSTFSTY